MPLELYTTSSLSFLLVIVIGSILPIVSTSMVTTTTTTSTTTSTDDMRFGKFLIPSLHIFYRTPRSAAFVNLRPIVPGHVLVMPERLVATMEDLSEDEYLDLWKSVRVVQKVLKDHYKEQATAFNVAVQDGRAAGQSVPHVHVHILPRKGGDFERNDDVYEELDQWAPRNTEGMVSANEPSSTTIDVPNDTDRVDRTTEMMEDEASSYRQLLEGSKL